jgi:hypothetical protein
MKELEKAMELMKDKEFQEKVRVGYVHRVCVCVRKHLGVRTGVHFIYHEVCVCM